MNRSSDILVAGGWNVATASLFTYLIAKLTDLIPGKLYWITGDVHIYLNNIEPAKQVIERLPMPFPKLNIKKNYTTLNEMLELKYEDLELINYNPNKPQIKVQMNV
jgi:thymidylate synthase